MQNRMDATEINSESPQESTISFDKNFTDAENLLICQIVEELGSTGEAKLLADYKNQLKLAQSRINFLQDKLVQAKEEVSFLKIQLTQNSENTEEKSETPPSSPAAKVSQNKESFFLNPSLQTEHDVRNSCTGSRFCIIL